MGHVRGSEPGLHWLEVAWAGKRMSPHGSLEAILTCLSDEGCHPAALAILFPPGEERNRILDACSLRKAVRWALAGLNFRGDGDLLLEPKDLAFLAPLADAQLNLPLNRLTLRGWEGRTLPKGVSGFAVETFVLEDCPNLKELPIEGELGQLSLIRSGAWRELPFGEEESPWFDLELEGCESLARLPENLDNGELRVSHCVNLELPVHGVFGRLQVENCPLVTRLPEPQRPTGQAYLNLKHLPFLVTLPPGLWSLVFLQDLPRLEDAGEVRFSHWAVVDRCPQLKYQPLPTLEEAKGVWMGSSRSLCTLSARNDCWEYHAMAPASNSYKVESPNLMPEESLGPKFWVSSPPPWEEGFPELLQLTHLEKVKWLCDEGRALQDVLWGLLRACQDPFEALEQALVWSVDPKCLRLLPDLLEAIGIHRASLERKSGRPWRLVWEGKGAWVAEDSPEVLIQDDLQNIPFLVRGGLTLKGPFQAWPRWIRTEHSRWRKGNLSLTANPLIKSLPDWMEIDGDLVLEDLPNLRAWGRHLRVGGELRIKNVPLLRPHPNFLKDVQ